MKQSSLFDVAADRTSSPAEAAEKAVETRSAPEPSTVQQAAAAAPESSGWMDALIGYVGAWK